MNIFIASSSEAFSYAEAIQTLLEEKGFNTTTWKDAEFDLSTTIIESLESIKSIYDYAIFVFHPDDEMSFRGNSIKSVRDNVIFEFGLFVGVLGIKKCYAIVPNNISIKQPSDLLGVINAKYKFVKDDKHIEKNLRSSIKKISDSIDKQNTPLSKKHEFLVRGDYRDSIVDASVSIEILDFELHDQWLQYIREAKKVKEELLYWEQSTAGKWLEFEEYSESSLSHIEEVGESLRKTMDQPIDFISLGPGSGKKDVAFISTLVNQDHTNWYYPIDISSHLLFKALKSITASFDDSYLKVKGVRANFNSLEKLKYVYQYTNQINIFTLFGNTLGNYNEKELLSTIKRSMFKNDLLVIETNKIIEKDANSKYNNSNYHAFVLEPLHSFGLEPKIESLMFEQAKDAISSIDGAERISANYYLSKTDKEFFKIGTDKITITYSTHYDQENIVKFVEKLGFEVVHCIDANDQLTIVLRNV